MMKLTKKNKMGESIQAYAANVYCTCNCTDCICNMCYPGDDQHYCSIYQVDMNVINSYNQTKFNIANGLV